MTSLRSWFVSMAAFATILASVPAQAQSQPQSQPQAQTKPSLFGGRATVHFNFGAQTGSGDISQTFTPLIYDEPATINIAQTYETGGLIDVGGSYMVHGDFGVGVSYSHTSGDGDAAIAAQIPHPLFADQPRSASATATGLDHSENAVHISMLYRFAATPKLDVTVGLGPTFFSVNQDLVPTVDVSEASGGPVITPVVVLLRYAKSTAEVSAADSPAVDVRAGGFQIAVGVRVRF